MLTQRSEESIFAEAVDLPSPEAKAAFLDAACGGDAALRVRVEKLLKSHTGAGSFLQPPVPLTTDEPLVERPGTIIGPYKLLQQIGEGGMGVVYMAEQEHPVRRRVALKIIKPGMDSRQVVARFEAERQALAMMDHQNIAKVLDAGTTESGRPYFVMELVHGVPITKFCDDNRLALRQRLELFVPVCHAIQHAHQKGIIHRDIKPTNILVTMYDDKPVPKVIDFGVAKAVEQRLTEKTLFTQYGMLVGTFEYMSPEQAEMNAFGVDTRSDVYSLGVLLYELLTGTTPLERQRLREAALVELVRLIKEEEPPRPSVRLSTSGTLPKFAAACRTEPSQLSQLLRGELDWIVMKCLEKDRARRYETANGLARDVERFLKDEPVEACPPSVAYRLRKVLRRHRRSVIAGAALSVFLVLVLINHLAGYFALKTARGIAWDQANRARMAEAEALDNLQQARRQQARAEEAEQAAQNDRDRALAAERAAIAAKEQAESATQRLRMATQIASEGVQMLHRNNWAAASERFAKAEEIESSLRSIYVFRGGMYTTLGLWDRAAEDYDRRFQLASEDSAQACFEHALLRYYVGDEAGYRRACDELVRQHGRSNLRATHQWVMRARLLAPQPVGDPEDLARQAEAMIADNYTPGNVLLGSLAQLRAGRLDKAASRARESLNRSSDYLFRTSLLALAMALHRLGQKADAEQALAQAETAIDEFTKAAERGQVGTLPVEWWVWLMHRIMYREARLLISGAAPPDDPRWAALYDRALAATTAGDVYTHHQAARKHVEAQVWDAAADSFALVLDQLGEKTLGASAEMRMCFEMVQHPEVFDRVVKLRPRSFHPWYARGRLHAIAREWNSASANYERAIELVSAATKRRIMQIELAAIYLLEGREVAYRDLCADMIGEQDVRNSTIAQVIARACALRPGAVSDLGAPLRVAEAAVAFAPQDCWHHYALGAAQYRAGQHAAAIGALEKSLEIHPAWIGRAQNFCYLAMAGHAMNRQGEARDWLAKADKSMQDLEGLRESRRFGLANSEYLMDWLSVLVLLPEAQTMLAASE